VTRRNSGAPGSWWVATLWVACALLLIFASGRLEAQIQVTCLNSGNCSGFSTSGSVSIASLTVPSSGLPAGDTYFIAGVSCFASSSCGTSFTWTGTTTGSWTQIGSSIADNFRVAEIWYVKGPSGSSKTLTVATSGASKSVAGELFVAGVNTSTPFGTLASANNGGGTSNNPNPITLSVTSTNGLVSGDLVVVVGGFHQAICGGSSGNVTGCTANSSPASETTQWEVLTSSSSSNVVGLGGTAIATSTSQTMGWNTSGTGNAWSIAAIPIHAQAAAAAPARKGQTIVGQLHPPDRGGAGE